MIRELIVRSLRPVAVVSAALFLTAAAAGCSGRPGTPGPSTTTPGPTVAPGPSGGLPVLLVGGTFESVSVLGRAQSFLNARGYRTYTMQLLGTPVGTAGSAQSGQAICRKIDSILAETGAPQVALAGHSQGSITGRWCIKNGGAADKVATFVSVGGVDNGTTTANLCVGQGCTDMRHGSAFLAQLNAGDTTPGSARYYKIYSRPSSGGVEGEDAPIRGATNVSAQQLCAGKSLLHANEYLDTTVLTFLDNVIAGRAATGTC